MEALSRPPAVPTPSWSRILLLLVLILVPAALVARWTLVPDAPGRSFAPWPDGFEYVAGARSLADDGTYLLQVGPHRVRPRYAPGWSMLLAPLLALGLEPQELFRVQAVFAAAHCVLLGLVVWLLLGALACGSGRLRLGAALATGLGWALAPLSLQNCGLMLCDEATACIVHVALVLAAVALLRPSARGAAGPAMGAGLGLGTAAGMRLAEGALALPVLALLLFAGLHRAGAAATLRRCGLMAIGLVIPVVAICLVLARSGLEPWTWQGYSFWLRDLHASLTSPFALDHALHGSAAAPVPTPDGTVLGNVAVPARVLLGWPLTSYLGLGSFWPALALLAGVPVLLRFARADRTRLLVALALPAWLFGHAILYSLYFYPDERFLLAPAAWLWPALICGSVLLWSERPPPLRWVAPALLLFAASMQVRAIAGIDRSWKHGELPALSEARREVPAWLALDDRERGWLPIPFDTVAAQALGLLPQRKLALLSTWGRLDERFDHARRLLFHGVVQPASPQAPLPPDPASGRRRFPAGAYAEATTRLRYEGSQRSFRFDVDDLDGRPLLRLRVPIEPLDEGRGLELYEELHGLAPALALRLTAGVDRRPLRLVGAETFGRSLRLRLDEELGGAATWTLTPHGRCLELRLDTAQETGTELHLTQGPGRFGDGAIRVGVADPDLVTLWSGGCGLSLRFERDLCVDDSSGGPVEVAGSRFEDPRGLRIPAGNPGTGPVALLWLCVSDRESDHEPIEVDLHAADRDAAGSPPVLAQVRLRPTGTDWLLGFDSDRPLVRAGVQVTADRSGQVLDLALAEPGPARMRWTARILRRSEAVHLTPLGQDAAGRVGTGEAVPGRTR